MTLILNAKISFDLDMDCAGFCDEISIANGVCVCFKLFSSILLYLSVYSSPIVSFHSIPFYYILLKYVCDDVPVTVDRLGTNSYLRYTHNSHHWYCQHHPLIVIQNPFPIWICACAVPLCVQTIFSPPTQ